MILILQTGVRIVHLRLLPATPADFRREEAAPNQEHLQEQADPVRPRQQAGSLLGGLPSGNIHQDFVRSPRTQAGRWRPNAGAEKSSLWNRS